MNTRTLTTYTYDERTIFWSLVGILFMSFFLYIYCITTTIHNVVARQNATTRVSDLALTIGQKEFHYMSLKNQITAVRVADLGFIEVDKKTFITPQSVGFASDVSSISNAQNNI